MSTFTSKLLSGTRVSEIIATLTKHRNLILIPTILCTLIAGWYAMKPKSWQASQSLEVRDDMIGESFKPGRFESLDSMKAAQETILHIAREPAVVKQALETIGPPKGKGEDWLEGDAGIDVVESTRESISIVAPNGAEFGTTYVIVLQVKAKSRERAGLFVSALLEKVESQLRNMRTRKLESMELELKQSLDLAEEDYLQFADELKELEHKIGPDLPTLLNMINDGNATNDFQVALENIRTSRRAAQAKLDITTKHLEVLRATVDAPQQLVATPNGLLQAQPALERLKDGLVDLQLKLSDDLGKFRSAHPKVIEAREAIAEAKRQIHDELQIAIRGLESQQAVQAQQLQRLNGEEEHQQERLIRLTNNRAVYANLALQAKKRSEEHAKTRAEYSEIKSLGQAAKKVNLMTRLEGPFVSGKPLGPGRTTILGSGTLGGILIGLGLVMFISAPSLPIIEPPAGPGENMVRPVDQPNPPAPTSNRPTMPDSSQGRPAVRPVQVVKQLDETPVARQVPSQVPQATRVPEPPTAPSLPQVPQVPVTNPVEKVISKSKGPAPVTPVGKLSEGPATRAKPAQVPKTQMPKVAPAAPSPPAAAASPQTPEQSASFARATAKTASRTKVAPPRVKSGKPDSSTETLTANSTIPLPLPEEAPEKTICLNDLREELGAPPARPFANDLPPAKSLDDVKNQLISSALGQSKPSSTPEKTPDVSSIQDRIKRLIDVPKNPGQ